MMELLDSVTFDASSAWFLCLSNRLPAEVEPILNADFDMNDPRPILNKGSSLWPSNTALKQYCIITRATTKPITT